jgi:hypothetical protein
VSANAQTVAYSVVHCASGATGHLSGSHPIGDIGVINLATTQVKHWSFTLNEDYTSDLSLSADGGLAGFSSYLDTSAPGTVQVGRVLPTSTQPGTVQQRDRIVVRSPATTGKGLDAVALSPDGHTMYACTQSGSSDTDVTQTLAAYDTATGQMTSVLRTWALGIRPAVSQPTRLAATCSWPPPRDLISQDTARPQWGHRYCRQRPGGPSADLR